MLATSVSASCRPSLRRGLRLDLRPGGHAAVGRAEQLAGGDRAAGGVVDVLAQEDLVRRVRGVGLALVDERRVDVQRLVDVVGALVDERGGGVVARDAVGTGTVRRPGDGHEPKARREVVRVAEDVVVAGDERVVVAGAARTQCRDAAVDDLVDAVVEELAEDREQRVERRREADVGGDVRDEQRLVLRRAAVRRPSGRPAGRSEDRTGPRSRVGALRADRVAGGRDRRGVRGRLVDDQVADVARAASRRRDPSSARTTSVIRPRPDRSADRSPAARVRRLERRSGQTREDLARRAVGRLTGLQVVAGSVDRPQTLRGAAGSGSGPARCRAARHTVRSRGVVFATCASAILICFRMYARSAAADREALTDRCSCRGSRSADGEACR